MSWLTTRWTLYATIYDFFIGSLSRHARQLSIDLLQLQPNDHIAILGSKFDYAWHAINLELILLYGNPAQLWA